MIRHLLSSPLSPVFTGSQDEGSCARSSAAQGRARPIPGWGQPLTQREIADQRGISRSYVSRLEKKALAKLRAVFEA